jgi:L-ribulose-5-phosphate 4-epimerase
VFEELRREVLAANLEIARAGLAPHTWGNASGIDREKGVVVIKPSGVAYASMRAEDLVAVALLDGSVVEGSLRPSSDLATHLVLYRAFVGIGGVVHTHSRYATGWAQAGREIPCFGTTHADYFFGPIPVAPALTEGECESDYEENTGRAIVQRFAGLDPLAVPGVLLHGHAPFTWGRSAGVAVHHAAVLEEVAEMAWMTVQLNPGAKGIPGYLLEKHYRRKHGPLAYYGQG